MSELYIKVKDGVVLGDPVFRGNLLQSGIQENDGGGFEGYMPFVRVQAPIPQLDEVINSHEYKIAEDHVTDWWNIEKKSHQQYEIDIFIFVEGMLDNFAKTKKYRTIISLCSYINDPNPVYASEAKYAIELRSKTWEKTYEILNLMESGQKQYLKSYNEFEKELPLMVWEDMLDA